MKQIFRIVASRFVRLLLPSICLLVGLLFLGYFRQWFGSELFIARAVYILLGFALFLLVGILFVWAWKR